MKSRWYVIHVQSNMEKRVKELIEEKALGAGLDGYLKSVLIPTEKVIDIKNNKKVEVERKFFPGYVLVEAMLNDQLWHIIKNTPKVTGFLGSRNKPSPISEKEVAQILDKSLANNEITDTGISNYSIGEEIKVIAGPFASFNGIIEDIDEAKARLKVTVSIFGRSTPISLEAEQVEKA